MQYIYSSRGHTSLVLQGSWVAAVFEGWLSTSPSQESLILSLDRLFERPFWCVFASQSFSLKVMISRGGRIIQILYWSKSRNTTLWKYSTSRESPSFKTLLKWKYVVLSAKCTLSKVLKSYEGVIGTMKCNHLASLGIKAISSVLLTCGSWQHQNISACFCNAQ